MSEEDKKRKNLLTLRDLQAVEVRRSSLTSEMPKLSTQAMRVAAAAEEEKERQAEEENRARAAEEAARREAEQVELDRKLAEAEALRAVESAKRARRQAVLLTLVGLLAGAVLVAILALVFRPSPLSTSEVRAQSLPVIAVQSPEREMGFLAIPEVEEEEAAPAPRSTPRRARERPAARPSPRPGVDAGSLF